MNAREYIVTDVADRATTCDIYRSDSDGVYNSDYERVGETAVYIFSASSTTTISIEGSGQDTSLVGLTTPSYGRQGKLVHDVEVNDQLRVNDRQYRVETKDAIGDELDPQLWQLGLERANVEE